MDEPAITGVYLSPDRNAVRVVLDDGEVGIVEVSNDGHSSHPDDIDNVPGDWQPLYVPAAV